jgi:ankyrin repeat protein
MQGSGGSTINPLFSPVMRKISFISSAAMLALALATPPALAQSAPASTGGSSPSGNLQAPPLQPKSDDNQVLPPALPGAGNVAPSTAPSVAKQQSGDPTTQLFTAINGNDYASAQDAISRGADLNAQNALGETPIDLSVSLNRNSITFMLLAARNDSGDGSNESGPMPSPAVSGVAPKGSASAAATPIKLIGTPTPAASNNPGTPNPSAGFLGFGKN